MTASFIIFFQLLVMKISLATDLESNFLTLNAVLVKLIRCLKRKSKINKVVCQFLNDLSGINEAGKNKLKRSRMTKNLTSFYVMRVPF